MMGTPCVKLSSTEFQPQWLRNAPVDLWDSMSCWGAHVFTTSPCLFCLTLFSNPSGSHSPLNASVTLNPIGGLITQMNAFPLASSPFASSIICAGNMEFCDPNET
uniref:Uncharacterized protein n=1 Tax=Kalanchoe fedtschenkoi TaxID=63787 RepID=A0A7N0UN73_KALFE